MQEVYCDKITYGEHITATASVFIVHLFLGLVHDKCLDYFCYCKSAKDVKNVMAEIIKEKNLLGGYASEDLFS